MLGVMRKYKQSFIIKGVFIVIVLSFVGTIFLIWGKGEEGLGGSQYAAKVNGDKISFQEYSRGYEQIKTSFQQMYGQPITPEIEKQLGLRKMAIENLINATLVQQEAKRMGIKVSDKEIIDDISKMQYFKTNGVFDKQKYEQVLKMNRISPSDFEEAIRKEILMRKARNSVLDEVKVGDVEAIEAFRKQRDQINLQFVSFSPADMRKDIKVTDKELNAYLEQHKKEFMTQEEISVSYLLLTPDAIASKVTVSEDDLTTYYQKNIDRYQGKGGILPFTEVRERVKADCTRFKAAKKAYEMAADAYNKTHKTGDLKAAAAMLGVTTSDTPLFSMKTLPAAISGETGLIQKAFSLKQGELGGPVETEKGVYLFKVLKRNPSAVPPLDKIRSEVEKRVLAEMSLDLARKKASDAQSRMGKGPLGESLQETGNFMYSAKGTIPGIGESKELMEAAFLLKTNAPAPKSPFQVNGRWYAVRLKNRTETPLDDFKKERAKIITELRPRKQQEAMEKWLKGLRDKAKINVNAALTGE